MVLIDIYILYVTIKGSFTWCTRFSTTLWFGPSWSSCVCVCVCTVSVPFVLSVSAAQSRGGVQQNSSRWSRSLLCVSLRLHSAAKMKHFQRVFISFHEELIRCGKPKGFVEERTLVADPTHRSHMPAVRGHTHVRLLTHTQRVCPIQCTVALNNCGMNFRRSLGSVLIVWRFFFFLFSLLTETPEGTPFSFFLVPLIKLQLHSVYSVHQNAFSSEISMGYEMNPGSAINEIIREWNRKWHTSSIFSSVKKPAGFPADLFFSRLESRLGGSFGTNCASHHRNN